MAPAEWSGYCAICEKAVVFREYGPWHRDQLVCTTCGSIPRQRAILTVLSIVRPNWRQDRVWELAPAGPASGKLRNECSRYLGSQYWPDIPPGALVDGYRCEDLERPTLSDSSMDIIVSSDVFEHIIDVDAALAQVARVLADGGIHVWTAPQSQDLNVSRPRVRRSPRGLEFLESAEYHDDPVNPGGALVTYDWGRDLPARVMVVSGMWTSVFRLESRVHGLLGEFLEVFVSHRGSHDVVAFDVRNLIEPLTDDLRRARAELHACQDNFAAMQSSRSWRVTEPLRTISAMIRRNLGRHQL